MRRCRIGGEGKGEPLVSNIAEIRRRIDGIRATIVGMKERVAGLVRSAGPELKEKLKKEGTRLGLGSGLSLFGLMVLAVAAVYLVAALILTLDLALERLWLSALIVVGALFLLGALVAGIGASVARRSAKRLQEVAEEANREASAAVEEMVGEVRGELEILQELARREAEERRRQVLQAVETLRRSAPAIVALLVLLALLRRHRRRKRMKRSAEAPVLIREVIREEGE